MNDHSAPPGGWQPPEPPWMKRGDEIVLALREEVDRFVREKRLGYRNGFLIWLAGGMLGGTIGYLIGFGVVELLRWWVGLK